VAAKAEGFLHLRFLLVVDSVVDSVEASVEASEVRPMPNRNQCTTKAHSAETLVADIEARPMPNLCSSNSPYSMIREVLIREVFQ
jgi:hypothetical protein